MSTTKCFLGILNKKYTKVSSYNPDGIYSMVRERKYNVILTLIITLITRKQYFTYSVNTGSDYV